jgi:urate oxidase
VDVFDARVRGTPAQRRFDPFDSVRIAFDQGFDLTIMGVAHPAMDAFACGGVFREHPEPDPLHAPANHVAPRDEHETSDYTMARMVHIHSTSYGESRLRLLRILRHGDRHDPKDVTIALRFEGDFAHAFRDGQAGGLPPGEAVKNLVHRVAAEQDFSEIEQLGLEICRRIMDGHPTIGLTRVELSEGHWSRLEAGGKAQGQAFTPGGVERRTASITGNGSQVAVSSGIDNLILLRTAGLAPPQPAMQPDDGTTDGVQGLLIAALTARWSYSSGDIAFKTYRQGVRAAVIETFAWHASHSVQHTLYGIAEVILATYQEISVVTLTLQERPYRPVDLLEMERNDLFVARDEPLGIVEVTVERS